MSKDSISAGQELRLENYLLSNNGNYKAVFEHNGNLVIYTWKQVWSSQTSSESPVQAFLATDGNLIMYNKNGSKVWDSRSHIKTLCDSIRLTMNDDGHLVIDGNLEPIWIKP
ncbi:hypothetical protein LDENG_00274100 [Lucifuga dentata]|nr:hypothetical protein LDENG_00274100 [Lucifuga dentata]